MPGSDKPSVSWEPLTMEELLALPVSFGLRMLARAVGVGKGKIYEYANAGAVPGDPPCPIRRIGGEFKATRPELFRYLGLDPAAVAVPVVPITPGAGVAPSAHAA
jgi:hypothetical protein